MRNIKLVIEYDGTAFHGWQSQINARAVQDEVSNAVKIVTGEECELIGASRTDTGVHALGQVANFLTASNIPPDKYVYALRSVLPDDVVIKRSEEVPADFHSRYSAKGKRYRYLIYNSVSASALLRNRAWHIPQRLDFNAMCKAVPYFTGTHDFSAFRASGSSTKTSTRTIHEAELDKDGDIMCFTISGSGFLYNMVRIIAGTLFEVGCGKIDPDSIPEIIEGRDRKKAGITAPAHGLYLEEIFY